MCAGCWQDHAGRIARLTLWDLRNSVLHSGRGSAFTIEDFIKLPASVACSHSTVLQLVTGTCDSKRAPPGQPNSTDISRAFAADMISHFWPRGSWKAPCRIFGCCTPMPPPSTESIEAPRSILEVSGSFPETSGKTRKFPNDPAGCSPSFRQVSGGLDSGYGPMVAFTV